MDCCFAITRFSVPPETQTLGSVVLYLHMTIQPCCQVPDEAHVRLSADRHRVTAVFLLIASLRASCALATKLFAKDASLLLRMLSLNDGAAIAARIATMAIVTINSIS